MNFPTLVADIAQLNGAAQFAAARAVDRLLTLRSWLIGAWIVEYEQNGEDRAAYGEALLDRLAEELAQKGTQGVSRSNLKNFRQLVLTWPDLDPSRALLAVVGSIRQTPSGESIPEAIPKDSPGEAVLLPRTNPAFSALAARTAALDRLPWQDLAWTERLFASLSFSHLLELSRIDLPLKRAFYELQTLKECWSVRELKRQVNTMLFERAGLSRDKAAVMSLSRDGRLLETPATILRDPYILEFLGLPEPAAFSEAELEAALLDISMIFYESWAEIFVLWNASFASQSAGNTTTWTSYSSIVACAAWSPLTSRSAISTTVTQGRCTSTSTGSRRT